MQCAPHYVQQRRCRAVLAYNVKDPIQPRIFAEESRYRPALDAGVMWECRVDDHGKDQSSVNGRYIPVVMSRRLASCTTVMVTQRLSQKDLPRPRGFHPAPIPLTEMHQFDRSQVPNSCFEARSITAID
jgi:hypothetical protein